MNGWTYACLVVGLLFLAAPAGALIPDDVKITTSPEWLTAGSGGSSTVTVKVTNGTLATPVVGAAVYLAVDDDEYGSISRTYVVTGDDGKATAIFRHGTRSGTATITATVSHEELDAPLTGSVEQQIDHAAPHKIANLWYEPEVTAGETTEIVVRMVDKYGNVVDSRRENAEGGVPEKVTFMVGSPTGGATFDNGWDNITVSVDAAGNATATLQVVDTLAGENLVSIYPPAPIVSDMISITGVGGLPVNIKTVVDPDDASVRANGEDKVSFTYTLLDKYGNPAAGQGLWVNATLKRLSQPDEQESRLLNTNSYGQVMITYGPEDSVGMANITATAMADPGVTNTTRVEFISTDATNMLLTASPQSMPSGDVPGSVPAILRAKVMDVKGNPVENEDVKFEIISFNFNGYNQTAPPCFGEGLSVTSAKTNADGYAIAEFHPGVFTTDPNAANYSETATGTATVRATWKNVSRGIEVPRDIELTWKNYPYLSVETEVSPETVGVGDTVDVTIRLKGDGHKLQPNPIDVVLVIDRSSSMNRAIDGSHYPSGERITAAKVAAYTFIKEMNPAWDRIGLVSYDKDASCNPGLTGVHSKVNSSIKNLNLGSGTGTRNGLYVAIQELIDNDNDNDAAVRAVILMTDGEYNWYGDPLARGEKDNTIENYGYTASRNYYNFTSLNEQNLSAYAKDMKIRIYTIAFTKDVGEKSETSKTMKILANATGGKYYHAKTSGELVGVYTDIAGELVTEAGVDTKLDVVFENVEVNGNPTSGADVFDYVHEENVSTVIESWIDNKTPPYVIIPRYTHDHTTNWTAETPLSFNIGTVRLGQTWETTFRLTVKEEGNINIFGPGSKITFNDGLSLDLPDTFITALPLTNTGMNFSVLEITNLTFTGTEPVDEFLPVAWDLNYTGLYDVTEDLFYSNDNEYTWVKFDTLTATNQTTNGTSTLDVRGLPPGEYIIRVRGSAPDTADAIAKIAQDVTAGATGDAYIRLE